MRKTTAKVFGFIAVLVAVFIAWQLFFNNGGILNYGYNKIAQGVNDQWAKVAGSNQELLPKWGNGSGSEDEGGTHKAATNGHGFTMTTEAGNSGEADNSDKQ